MEEFCDITLVSDDGHRIRAQKVVLASASPTFRDMFQNYECYTEYQVKPKLKKDKLMNSWT